MLSGSKKTELPYYWAGTVLMGKTMTLKSSHAFAWWVVLIIIPLLAFAGWRLRVFVTRGAKKSNEESTYVKAQP